jgi:hypothetical protein
LDQVHQIIRYNSFDSNGRKLAEPIVPNIDPYQFAAAIEIDTKDQEIILDGRSSLSFVILPNESILLVLETDCISLSDKLDLVGKNNLQTMVAKMQ